MLEKLKILFEKTEPLYIIERPEESKLFLSARDTMGRYIQTKMNENGGFTTNQGFAWLRKELTSPSFDDMNFKYKNQVFSLLVELKTNNKNILPENRKKIFYEECKNNNLIPCLFPIDAKTLTPLGKGWNLYNLITNDYIDPLKIATDDEIEMSDWEFNNFAIFNVLQFLNKNGYKIHSFCDAPGIIPQIWFKDKNRKPAWVIVKYYFYPTKYEDVKINEVDRVAAMVKQYDGYIAKVGLMPIEKNKTCRGAGFYLNIRDIEQVYWVKK